MGRLDFSCEKWRCVLVTSKDVKVPGALATQSGELASTICSRCRGGSAKPLGMPLWAWTGVAGSGSLFTLLLLALVVLGLLR